MSDNKHGIAPPAMRQWQHLIEPVAEARGIPPLFALKWLELESGGNPCAIGNPTEHAPDGLPREVGLAQSYNPDDLNAARIKSVDVRAYCVPGDNHAVTYRGRTVRGFSSALLRPLTPEEMATQVELAIATIARCMDRVSVDMARVGALWPERDYWTLVKLRHNLPALAGSALPAVAHRLGRAPSSWAELRAQLEDAGLHHVRLEPAAEARRADWPHLFEIAERCAGVL